MDKDDHLRMIWIVGHETLKNRGRQILMCSGPNCGADRFHSGISVADVLKASEEHIARMAADA